MSNVVRYEPTHRVAVLTVGEGGHNNQHAVPVAAKHGLAWYEIDMNWWGIATLRALGLAWDIKLNKLTPEAHEAQRAAAPVPANDAIASSPLLAPIVEEELVSGD